MIVKIFGAADLIVGICFLISGLIKIFPVNFILTIGAILMIKGIAFISKFNINSILDIIIGFAIILSAYLSIPFYITLIFSLYLLQKGILSFV